MFGRKLFHWEVQLLRGDGRSIEKRFSSFWSPEKIEHDSIGLSCAAAENAAAVRGGTKHQFRPISERLLDAEEPQAVAA